MSRELARRLFDELDRLVLIDPHTHINPHAAASKTLLDVLGYHYYTELAHSSGMPKARIEEPGIDPRTKFLRLAENLAPLSNTIQYSWFLEIAREFFGVELTADVAVWEKLYDTALVRMAQPGWEQQVLKQSGLEGVFLTNDFDDPLEGFDTKLYIPCLRTDDLVFHLARPEVRTRLEKASGVSVHNVATLRQALGNLFQHFVARGARACAISLPPDFTPARIDAGAAQEALTRVLSKGPDAIHTRQLGEFVFWTLAELCAEHKLPFDLMIGVNRRVYADGVFQGQDLFDSRVSLIQYRELFNAFPQVTFPISVLASVTNQELVAYSWIFPNVVTNGHWWYSNTPTFIEHDTSCRLEAVPRTKQIGYYSDMYKLEFALPKFRMYKRILAKVLSEKFVLDRGWSEGAALALGREVLRGNVERVFRV
jgi:glucuronate isomerase